ncbi:MAG: ribulose-phosphate 3-epimerase [Tenericutes bacterium GWC2_34_14]|nr:MAG: ribulose-phosphate 3-epimerase [Tenericutes bacterium GWA2_35_7]OHE29168.1 MAG: ribulose-phosphate 3-epimerase [Tenericutes bacterium GWC2_34_14]OHE34251.1 MAG: ribulose-phosphate 3-epimerase [Tenericutes bacterium GWE2_34_108]OHE35603.1 MAG: ribulose-phosphate 3-epimerase [Tenericutes bacterium GWF1_35_14]OHE38819.1 MAG: ribulose-phosphate 3-epimerase [Tenericutes bacterium GWF2_35_184]OHE43850.1 MAG: ribulose-phosphate 3-epimerase [Tenericutes bacterium RIFOXYA2_FULL_36_32]OHE46254.
MMKIAPSVLTANFTNLEQEIKSIQTADYIHLDIMDGHFVPNISFGPAISKQIEAVTHLPIDVHLMVTDPLKWIPQFVFPQTKFITIHIEANHVQESVLAIQKERVGVGIAIKPKTPVRAIIPYLNDVSLILVMTVEPGFGGQSFMTEMMDKVRELVRLRKENGLNFVIEIDGGVNDETAKIAKEAGVDIVVAGSYLFNMEDRAKGIEVLK